MYSREYINNTISFVYDTCFYISSKINNRISRYASILICLILSIMWLTHPIINYQYCGYAMMIGMFSVSFLCCRNKKNTNKSYISILFLLVIGTIYGISGIVFTEGNKIVFAFTYAILLTIANILMTNDENRRSFIFSFSVAAQITFVFVFILSALFAPISVRQYSSITLNPNYLATVLIPIFLSGIWLYQYAFIKKSYRNIQLVLIGIELMFLLLTKSRTGMLCVMVCLIVFVIRFSIEKDIKGLFRYLFSNIVICILALQIVLMVFPVTTYLTMEVENMILGKSYFFETTNMRIVEDLDSIKENLDENRKLSIFDVIFGVLDRANQGVEEGEDVSSGRFTIWKACIDNMNFKGHLSYDTFNVGERNLKTNDPHNMVLSVGFQTGYMGAIIFAIFSVFCGVNWINRFVYWLRTKSISENDFFCLLIQSSFFVVAMFSSTYTPLGSMLGYAFWCLLPQKRD